MIGSLLRKFGILQGRRLLGNQLIVQPGLLHQAFEESELHKLFEYCNVDCVFDVGANLGQYAQMLRQQVGYTGLVISFEPIPEAATALRAAARHDPKWIIEEMAVSSRDGDQLLNIMRAPQFSSLSEPRHDEIDLFTQMNAVERSIVVKAETLETAYRRLHASHGFVRPFLKLDTQGYDVDIVLNAKQVIDRFVGLQSELAIRKLYANSRDFRDAVQVYEDCGFELTAFVPNNEGHFPRLVEMDCIMIRTGAVKRDATEPAVALSVRG